MGVKVRWMRRKREPRAAPAAVPPRSAAPSAAPLLAPVRNNTKASGAAFPSLGPSPLLRLPPPGLRGTTFAPQPQQLRCARQPLPEELGRARGRPRARSRRGRAAPAPARAMRRTAHERGAAEGPVRSRELLPPEEAVAAADALSLRLSREGRGLHSPQHGERPLESPFGSARCLGAGRLRRRRRGSRGLVVTGWGVREGRKGQSQGPRSRGVMS